MDRARSPLAKTLVFHSPSNVTRFLRVANAHWPRTAIDSFILARLEREGLAPSPEANKVTLIRRVTLDLTGLPPTPSEVDTFLADESPDAYETVVERLLKSPRYGERMATRWLDAARYADTSGYQNDGPRTMWRWRDWVIDALNSNMPFDQFNDRAACRRHAAKCDHCATDCHRLQSQPSGKFRRGDHPGRIRGRIRGRPS